jgi:hypothetical protein
VEKYEWQTQGLQKRPRKCKIQVKSDAMNPFGNMTSKHNTCLVLLQMYYLSSWLCMKKKIQHVNAYLRIEQTGNKIYIYLKLLVDKQQTLWKKWVKVHDAYTKEEFDIHTMSIFIVMTI